MFIVKVLCKNNLFNFIVTGIFQNDYKRFNNTDQACHPKKALNFCSFFCLVFCRWHAVVQGNKRDEPWRLAFPEFSHCPPRRFVILCNPVSTYFPETHQPYQFPYYIKPLCFFLFQPEELPVDGRDDYHGSHHTKTAPDQQQCHFLLFHHHVHSPVDFGNPAFQGLEEILLLALILHYPVLCRKLFFNIHEFGIPFKP